MGGGIGQKLRDTLQLADESDGEMLVLAAIGKTTTIIIIIIIIITFIVFLFFCRWWFGSYLDKSCFGTNYGIIQNNNNNNNNHSNSSNNIYIYIYIK